MCRRFRGRVSHAPARPVTLATEAFEYGRIYMRAALSSMRYYGRDTVDNTGKPVGQVLAPYGTRIFYKRGATRVESSADRSGNR